MGFFLDLFTGDIGFSFGGNTGLSDEGHLMSRVGDNAAIDLNTGELHLTTSWGDDDDNDSRGFNSNFGSDSNDPNKLF